MRQRQGGGDLAVDGPDESRRLTCSPGIRASGSMIHVNQIEPVGWDDRPAGAARARTKRFGQFVGRPFAFAGERERTMERSRFYREI
jgi:hypothetical protein